MRRAHAAGLHVVDGQGGVAAVLGEAEPRGRPGDDARIGPAVADLADALRHVTRPGVAQALVDQQGQGDPIDGLLARRLGGDRHGRVGLRHHLGVGPAAGRGRAQHLRIVPAARHADGLEGGERRIVLGRCDGRECERRGRRGEDRKTCHEWPWVISIWTRTARTIASRRGDCKAAGLRLGLTRRPSPPRARSSQWCSTAMPLPARRPRATTPRHWARRCGGGETADRLGRQEDIVGSNPLPDQISQSLPVVHIRTDSALQMILWMCRPEMRLGARFAQICATLEP